MIVFKAMTRNRRFCWICGRRAIAFHLEPDGRAKYLCEEHMPDVEKYSASKRPNERGSDADD